MATTTEIISNSQTNATNVMQYADAFLDALSIVANEDLTSGLENTTYNYATVPFEAVPAVNAAINTALSTVVAGAGAPTAPAARDEVTANPVTIPEFTDEAPTIDFGTVPSTELPDAPGAPDAFVAPDAVDVPVYTSPTLPVITVPNLPPVPGVSLPSLTSVLPTEELVTPTDSFAWYEAAYESTTLDPLQAKLLTDLEDGSYGIDTADETLLLNRARDREVEVALTRIGEAGRAMAARGFPLPPGELAVHIDRAWQDMQNKVSSVNREIYIDRAKRFVENRQFTIQEVRQLENILIGFHNSVQERALNAAKAALQFAIEIYNTQVAKYNAQLEAYKAEGARFAERIRGEVAKAEIYRIQMEGVRVQTEAQRSQVELYNAQWRGIQTQIDIYKTRVEAANLQIQAERARLEAFRETVNIYTAQVQAKVAEFEMYAKQVNAELGKVQVYDAQARAYTARVGGLKAQSEVYLENAKLNLENGRLDLLAFQGQLDGYKAEVLSRAEGLRAETERYRADVELERTRNESYQKSADRGVRAIESAEQRNIQISNLGIETAKTNLIARVEALRDRIEAKKYGAEKYFGIITATLNAINAIAVQSATST